MKDQSQKNHLSMYIHIPFCERKCAYCDFLSFDCKNEQINDYVDALCSQIEDYSKHDGEIDWVIKTIFFGGGTPSVLTTEHMTAIFKTINSNYDVLENAEISIECNPGTLTKEKINHYRTLGFNRISLGVQSTDFEKLKVLGRIHDEQSVFEQYGLIKASGFENINLDLMYGIPNQTLEEWSRQLDVIIDMNPEHISAYGLIVEEGTAYEKLFQKEPELFPDEDLERAMYWLAHEKLTVAGYEHYEISNFAKPGFACQHNETYWRLIPYIGFGLGASSYINGTRFDMIRDLDAYIGFKESPKKMMNEQSIIVSSKQSSMEEFMFLGLRRLAGISKKEFMALFGCGINSVYDDALDYLMRESLIQVIDDSILLTKRGIDISNYVLSHFLLSE